LIKFVFLSLYINIEKKNIRINNIKSPKMLTLRFFFPSVYVDTRSKLKSMADLAIIHDTKVQEIRGRSKRFSFASHKYIEITCKLERSEHHHWQS